ncbi:MAG: hypothetical protein ABI758_05395 [Candidatus Woesebacteria bacterium]
MKNQQGQVGIIILLITVVMLTLGISVASRSVGDVKISTSNEQANRALDAAESGVEQALSQNLNNFTPPSSGSGPISVNTQVSQQKVLEAFAEQGDTVGVDLNGLPQNTQVNVEWAKESTCNKNASVVLTIFNTSGTNPAVRRLYYRPKASSGCNNGDNFTDANNASTGGYKWMATINTLAGDQLMRIRPLYFGTDIHVSGTNLPTQAYTVRSTAQNSTSKETKVVEVNKTLPVPPNIFDYVLFSGTTITQ